MTNIWIAGFVDKAKERSKKKSWHFGNQQSTLRCVQCFQITKQTGCTA